MKELVESKTAGEIDALREEIGRQVESGEAMDVDYWSAVVSLLRLASFKATLKSEQRRLMEQSDRDVGIKRWLEGRKRGDAKKKKKKRKEMMMMKNERRCDPVESDLLRAMRWRESSVRSPSLALRSLDPMCESWTLNWIENN